MITDRTAEQVLAVRGVPADFVSQPSLRYIHKQLGATDLYFVANGRPQSIEAVASFRVTGRVPSSGTPTRGSSSWRHSTRRRMA